MLLGRRRESDSAKCGWCAHRSLSYYTHTRCTKAYPPPYTQIVSVANMAGDAGDKPKPKAKAKAPKAAPPDAGDTGLLAAAAAAAAEEGRRLLDVALDLGVRPGAARATRAITRSRAGAVTQQGCSTARAGALPSCARSMHRRRCSLTPAARLAGCLGLRRPKVRRHPQEPARDELRRGVCFVTGSFSRAATCSCSLASSPPPPPAASWCGAARVSLPRGFLSRVVWTAGLTR